MIRNKEDWWHVYKNTHEVQFQVPPHPVTNYNDQERTIHRFQSFDEYTSLINVYVTAVRHVGNKFIRWRHIQLLAMTQRTAIASRFSCYDAVGFGLKNKWKRSKNIYDYVSFISSRTHCKRVRGKYYHHKYLSLS